MPIRSALAALLLLTACNGDKSEYGTFDPWPADDTGDPQSASDTDAPSDTEVETESDTEVETESDTEVETESDTEVETDTDAPEDADGDGFTEDVDCDDEDADVFPGAVEVCNGLDDDCDALVDDEDDDLDTSTASTWYGDADGDGYGDADDARLTCEQPSGTVTDSTDCDDADATVNPDATEVCNEVDDDCDGDVDDEDASLDTSTADLFYADDDGDGFGDADAATFACEQPSGATTDDSDCDDADAAVNPDATEVCNEVDDDCDADTDETGAWWDESWPYRMLVEVTASSYDVDGPPVVTSVDFDGALAELGESGSFDEDSLRVVLQDCSLDQPELPSQFLDEVAGLLDATDHADSAGDGYGDVVFLYDEDGDTTSLETLSASSTVTFGLYFDTSGTDPAYSSGLTTSSTSLANDEIEAEFDTGAGGLLGELTLGSSDVLMSQVDSCCGNGVYTSAWSETPMYVTGTTSLVVDGPVVAVLESTGSLTDYDYTYVYAVFDGRRELWSKTWQVTTSSVALSHSGDFTSGIRPWESRQDDIADGATFDYDSTGYTWADTDNGTWGVAFGYRHAPLYLTSMSMYDPYLISIGNDYAASGSGSPVTVASGETLMDWPVMVVLPHDQSWADAQDELFGLMEGLTVSQGNAQALE